MSKLRHLFLLLLSFLLYALPTAVSAYVAEPSALPDFQVRFFTDHVRVEAGTPFDPKSNIESVRDAEGNPLKYAETLVPGTYIVIASDLYNAGEHPVYVYVMDGSGNLAFESYTVDIYYNYEPPEETGDYLIRVNRAMNTVTVYRPDSEGEYTIPCRVMVCSSGGYRTPLGSFRTSDKYEWRNLVNGVNGQYATRIYGQILFHSVPYYRMDPSTLEIEEFNKLGDDASLGCIRLRVVDAKWIYDNCPSGTQVEIYDDTASPGPLGKPRCVKIDPDSDQAGWDPTDPAAEIKEDAVK